jgi:hypothetical protein
MTLKPVSGFKSLETHHCITGSILHIYKTHKFDISEDMLLGLGSGMGFIYWHIKGAPPFIGGRANIERPGVEGLEKTIGCRTGVKVESFRTNSARKAEKVLLEMLDAGKPVMLQVDMGYLPYQNLPQDFHFGYHVIVAAGYNPVSRQILVADRDRDLHVISFEDLALARGSKFKPFPPQHAWWTYDFNAAHPPKPEDILVAIREVSESMLEPPVSNFGVKGIRKTANRVLKWPEFMENDELRRTCFNTFIFIDAMGGTGGGIFRYMYSRFLEEAAALTGEGRLEEIGGTMREIGDHWQEVAGIFKQSVAKDVEPKKILPETTAALLEIADQEERIWELLLTIV